MITQHIVRYIVTEWNVHKPLHGTKTVDTAGYLP